MKRQAWLDGAERVAELAKRVNEDEDEEGYTINFKNGSRFTATQIKVRPTPSLW